VLGSNPIGDGQAPTAIEEVEFQPLDAETGSAPPGTAGT
jgi:hypothetical protein